LFQSSHLWERTATQERPGWPQHLDVGILGLNPNNNNNNINNNNNDNNNNDDTII
jgi:hypothetical protein